MQALLTEYDRRGGNLIVSGAYVGSDMRDGRERKFLSDILHITPDGATRPAYKNTISGMGTSFDIYTTLNEEHYAATSIDIISPLALAFCTLTDADGRSVCVAYDGRDNRTFTMGFPFECITSAQKRSAIMRGILNFIFK